MSNIWYLKRAGQAFLTVFVVFNLTFILIHQLPGGPMSYLMGLLYQGGSSTLEQEQMIEIAKTYININPDAPLHVQYINYMSSVLQGDLGQSVWFGKPVTTILASAIPWTVFLFSISLSITFMIGIILGSIMAYYEGSKFDFGATLYSIVSTSIPYYVLAILLVFTLGNLWGIFPATGRYDDTTNPGLNLPFIAGVLYHAALPATSLILTEFGGWALGMRANSIKELGTEYLRVSQLRGLSDTRIATRYVGWNAVLPLYTALMISIGVLFGGSVILETIFLYKGLGFYLFKGISARDYPLMMGGFMLITVAVVIGIFIADMTYSVLDPRAKTKETETYGGINTSIFSFRTLYNLRNKFKLAPDRGSSEDLVERPESGSVLENIERDHDMTRWDHFYIKFDHRVLAPIKILLSDWRARLGTAIFTAFIFMATVGVVVLPRPQTDVTRMYVLPFQTPKYPLGTDGSGQPIFTMIVHATPYILQMVLSGAVFAIIVGAFVGIVAGYVGGLVDSILMTFTDVLLTIPGLPLVIVLAFFIQPTNPFLIGIILAVNNWTGLARSLRSQVLTLREEGYVEASRIMGMSTLQIGYEDILPNVMPYVAVNFMKASRRIIFESVGLYFLGIISSSKPNWGVMMNMAYQGGGALYNLSSFHWIFFPMLTIVLFSLGAILLAQGTDRVFNPRVRARHAETTTSEEEEEPSVTPSASFSD